MRPSQASLRQRHRDQGEVSLSEQLTVEQQISQRQAAAESQGDVVDLADESEPTTTKRVKREASHSAAAAKLSPDELRAEGVPEELIAHKTFSGDRPSLSLLLPAVDPYTVGQLNALYEHRIAVQGFMWGINSFDQWGVELGKVLAKRVKRTLEEARASGQPVAGVNPSTDHLLNLYLAGSAGSAEGPDALGLLEKKPEGGK